MDAPRHVAAHLARNLLSLRHARGLTQDALAKSAGVPRSTIANLESGGGNPSLTVLVKVAGRLGVRIAAREGAQVDRGGPAVALARPRRSAPAARAGAGPGRDARDDGPRACGHH